MAGGFSEDDRRTKKGSFRTGKVQGYLRGKTWYLCYHENGKRRRPHVGPDKEAAKQLAAQVNAQLGIGAPAALSFEPITIPELRDRWLRHHEEVLRSSVRTINRYRTATEDLIRFLDEHSVRHASHFHVAHAEEFVRHLRTIEVSPNGHANTAKRHLLDKGLCYILECCRTLFQFAAKRRHLSPYAENPFSALEIGRIPVETARPIDLFTAEQETQFFEACDDWQFPLFLTLAFTGLRPGELTHLFVEDIDLELGELHVRNKPQLGWQVKTRNERVIPLTAILVDILRHHLGGRTSGLLFRRRQWSPDEVDARHSTYETMSGALKMRVSEARNRSEQPLPREDLLRIAQRVWRGTGMVKEDWVRIDFMRLTRQIGLSGFTAPKVFRHQFATMLQEGRVDPLIRNELMGHVASGDKSAGHGLAMTAVYTHTRPQIRREQLEHALQAHLALAVAKEWLDRRIWF